MPFRTIMAAVRAGLPKVVCDLAGLSGVASIAYGAWLIFPPAGFLVGGALLLAGALLMGRRFGT
jgi:hypothetical protein